MIFIFLAIVAFVLLISAGWIVGGFNHLQTVRQGVKTQWSNIKTEYQRRADLFYNLVEAVKSHKKFEKETLVEIAQVRKGNFGKNKTEEAKKMKKMDNLFSKMFSGMNIVFERYPNLKSSEQHNALMEEVRVTEDRINVARTDYNDVVREYNTYVLTFPSNILAKLFNFAEEKFFENDEESNKPVRINLS